MTIIIPAYNCSKTLNRTLDSLIAQTNQNFKVVLVDDCSTESIYDIIRPYIKQLNITYIRNNENIGCGGSRQVGIDYVGTNDDYITFLDTDDVLLPNAINDFLQSIDNNINIDIIFSYFAIQPLNTTYIRHFNHGWYCNNHSTMMHGKVYNTQFLQQYNIHEDVRAGYYDDSFFNVQAFSVATNIVYIPHFTYLYIKTVDSVSENKFFGKNTAEQYANVTQLVLNALKKNDIQDFSNFNCQHQKNAQLFRTEHKQILDIELKKINKII